MVSSLLSRRLGWAVTGILGVYAVMAIGIAMTRVPWVDEAWFAGPGINLVENGHMGTLVLETDVTQSPFAPFVPLRMNERTYWQPPLYFVAQGAWYKIFGASLVSLRLLSVAWGVVALLATFSLVRLLTRDDAVALLATGLAGVDFLFVNSAGVGRMDMMSVALALSAFASYLALRERSLPWALLTGHALVAASGMTHGNGILALAGLLVLHVTYDLKKVNLRLVLTAAIPYVAGAIAWGAYILLDSEAFLTQFGTTLKSYPLGTLWDSLRQLVVHQYMEPYGLSAESTPISRLKMLILAAYVTGVVGVLVSPLRRAHGVKTLTRLSAVYMVLLTFMIGHKTWSYAVWLLPFYTSLLSVWFIRCWRERIVRREVLGVALTGLVALQIAICCNQIVKAPYLRNYLPAMDVVRKLDDGTGFIMGSAEIAFALGFSERVVDDPNLGFATGKEPSIIVMNDYYSGRIGLSERSANPGLHDYLNDVVSRRFEKVFQNEMYQIYARRRREADASLSFTGVVGRTKPSSALKSRVSAEQEIR